MSRVVSTTSCAAARAATLEHHSLTRATTRFGVVQLTREKLLRALITDSDARRIEREIILDAIDQKWREHLYEMDYLKTGIGLRALAQRDPVVEFQREGYDMFVRMLEALKEQCIASVFGTEL